MNKRSAPTLHNKQNQRTAKKYIRKLFEIQDNSQFENQCELNTARVALCSMYLSHFPIEERDGVLQQCSTKKTRNKKVPKSENNVKSTNSTEIYQTNPQTENTQHCEDVTEADATPNSSFDSTYAKIK